MVQRPRRESRGNRALLVLVDSRGSYTDTSIVDQTVLVALQHFGFPFRIHDLAAGPLTADLLDGLRGGRYRTVAPGRYPLVRGNGVAGRGR